MLWVQQGHVSLIGTRLLLLIMAVLFAEQVDTQDLDKERPRVVVTTDGEADDRCSMIRFLLSSNEFEVEAIVNNNSQFHWEGGEGWNALHPVDWVKHQIDLYAEVYPQLAKHDPKYPTPQQLLQRWKVGNVGAVGEMETRTEGAVFISEILLDRSDERPVWLQAWGGCSTIARALKIIQEDHPERMEEVAERTRLFLIWEQDQTYQEYIRPEWERFQIPTIISDQFDCMAYIWPKVLPEQQQAYFRSDWMRPNILENHGPLCSSYEAVNDAFHAEGDTPAFLHCIPNGLRSVQSPDWGGWGGRYVKVRNNVWLDPAPSQDWKHPTGRWTIDNSWSKRLENAQSEEEKRLRSNYFRPMTRWLDAVQNDFAARADWCVKDYADANHPPRVVLKDRLQRPVKTGEIVGLDASRTQDPDGDSLHFRWWLYREAGSYAGEFAWGSAEAISEFSVPADALPGQTLHLICEVRDSGVPALTRYQRVILTVGEHDNNEN